MSEKELSNYKNEEENIEHEEFMNKNIYGEGSVSCRKCKKNNVHYLSVQIRSADEVKIFYL